MGSRLEKNSAAVRKRIEDHTFSDEAGEEYEASAFGGFPDYFRRKKIKLQNLDADLRASSSDKPQIFKGIVVHVTGYTQPPLHVLHRDLVQHGAGFLQYLDSKTMATHIIASSLPPKKTIDFNKYRIVKPAWVEDSIKAGRMLPWSDYRVIDEGQRQKTLAFEGGKISAQANHPRSGYRDQTDNSFYTSQLKNFAQAIDGNFESSQMLRGSMDVTSQSKITQKAIVAGRVAEPEMTSSGPAKISPSMSAQIEKMPPQLNPSPAEELTVPDEAKSGSFPVAPDHVRSESPTPQQPMTSEEHNAWLLKDPRMRKSSTANPDFIQQYYSESRLHHLSTWKAELKSSMQKLAAEKGQIKSKKRRPGSRRYIMHVDFDSFFCAVSLKSAPEFVDKPTVVAHGNGSGSEIASCNYPARKFGVKNGMWMKTALEKCPDLKILPYDFPAYEETSRLFYEAILEDGGVVQSVSIDEALVDISSVVLSASGSDGSGVDEGSIWREQAQADDIATSLRNRIKLKTGCAVSVGIGGNILQAKVALRRAKPAGQFQLKPEDVLSILGELKVDDLPGVAYSIAGKLEEISVKLVKDLRDVSKERLISVLGPKTGEKLFEYSRGIDRTEVGDQPLRKSVSAEVNWGIRFINKEEAEEFIYNLCKELERRLLSEQVKGKQLTMKIMRRSLDAPLDPAKHLGHGKCDTFNKSTLFGVATHDAQVIGKEAVAILRTFKFNPGDLRGLGLQMTKLEPIKAGLGPEGSQKRLNFGVFQAPTPIKKSLPDPIEEEHSPHKDVPRPSQSDLKDPIMDDPLTPRKLKGTPTHPALTIAKANEKDAKANTPLNIGGTQFIMPTNPDPAVIAELPPDIRSRLLNHGKAASESKDGSPSIRSRAQSPAVLEEIPPDVDPEVFNALPDDMKAEILGSYGRRAGQNRLPQSPRKDRIIQPSKKPTPTKKRVPGLFSRARERQADAQAKVVQTNLFSHRPRADGTEQGDEVEELDPEFLAELPEEVRKDVIADHRRKRAQRSGLDLKLNAKKHAETESDAAFSGGQMKLQFPARPPKISFTGGGLTELSQIRDMLNVWHRETLDEGPHRRDVEIFEKYLEKVVLEERDMGKVVKLIKWLDYVVEDDADSSGKRSWQAVVKNIRDGVQEVVGKRGLAPLDMS